MPDAVVVSRTEFVEIAADQGEKPATLTVTIGDVQAGGTAVMVDGQVVHASDNVKNLVLGKSKELRGKEVACTTTVQDINPNSNRTSVTYTLRFGDAVQEFPYQVTVSESGGRAVYLISFELS
jgi:hypothetical protein